MIIKRIPLESHLEFNDIDGIKREWNGIPITNRIPFLLKKEQISKSLLADPDNPNNIRLFEQALELAGLKREWLTNGEASLIPDFLFGGVDERGAVPGLVEATEFPYSEPLIAPEEGEEIEVSQPKRCDRIWVTGINGSRIIVNPLTGDQNKELDGYRSVIVDLDIKIGVAEAYDTIDDFRYCCDCILTLYGIDPEQIRISQLSELIFCPGHLGSLEIPLSQTIGGEALPPDEDPYDSVLASLALICPSVPIHEHAKLMNSMPWVQVMSVVNSLNTLVEKREEESESRAPRGKGKSKGGKPKPWKKKEFDHTKSLLDKLKSGDAEITPMSKMQRAALGG